MKYQVLGHRRRIQKGDKPYDVICEFDDLVQLYYMMNQANRNIYDEVLVINTYTNELVANKELEGPYTKRRKK